MRRGDKMELRIKYFLAVLAFGIVALSFVGLVHLLKDLFWFFPAIACLIFMWIIILLGRNA